MKILLIHSDFIEFYPRQKAIKAAEEWKQEKERIDECLVVFTSVEKNDEKDVGKIVQNFVSEIKKVAEEVKSDKIVLYPYAHLSKELASADVALKVLKDA